MKNKIMALLIIAIVLVGMILFINDTGYKNIGQCPQYTNCYCVQEYGENYYFGYSNNSSLPYCIIKGE